MDTTARQWDSSVVSDDSATVRITYSAEGRPILVTFSRRIRQTGSGSEQQHAARVESGVTGCHAETFSQEDDQERTTETTTKGGAVKMAGFIFLLFAVAIFGGTPFLEAVRAAFGALCKLTRSIVSALWKR